MIKPVILRAVCVTNIHKAVGVQHQFFGDFATHKQDFGLVSSEKKILRKPYADDSV